MSWLNTLVISVVFAALAWFLTGSLGESVSSPALIAAVFAFAGVVIGRALAGSSSTAYSQEDDQDVTTLFVGNLAFKANRHQVNELFAPHGFIKSVRIVNDRQTRKPKGYGFVEVATSDVDNVLKNVNGLEFMGRQLTVSVAKDKR